MRNVKLQPRKTSITGTFDGVPVQGEKTVSNNGRRIKAVWDFPNGGKTVEKEKLNNAGQTVSYRSVSKKINPKKVPKQEIDYNSKLDQKKGKYKYEHIAYFDNKAYFGKGVHNPRNKKAKVTYDFPNGGKRVVVERFNDANDVVSRRIKDVKQNPKRVKKQ